MRLLTWMLPDASHLVLCEGWSKTPYLARHGKPPRLTRLAGSAGALIGMARQRYGRLFPPEMDP